MKHKKRRCRRWAQWSRGNHQPLFANLGNGDIGSPSGAAKVQQFCQLDEGAPNVLPNLMRAAMQQMNLSARGYHRVLKLARTIADLAEEGEVV